MAKLQKRKAIAAVPKDESEVDSDSGASDSENDDGEQGNAGWANSIAKVLSTTKPKTKKTLVLSRAKKVKPGEEKQKAPVEAYGFEVEGEIKEEKPDKTELDDKLKQKKNMQLSLRVRPSWKDLERERTLRKVATKGVVQLFNAVRMQQKDLKHQLEEAGPLDSRKEAVLNNINKRKFLDVLMSGKRSKSEAIDNAVKDEVKEESSDDENDRGNAGGKKKSEWSVLRSDFMTNKKIKHWDEEDSEHNSADDSGDANSSEGEDND